MRIGGLKEKIADKEVPNATQVGYLRQLNIGYNQYAGTVAYEEIRIRRARNKAARKARRINRRAK
jgi:hypothetical protein